jgi:hypothetical protein
MICKLVSLNQPFITQTFPTEISETLDLFKFSKDFLERLNPILELGLRFYQNPQGNLPKINPQEILATIFQKLSPHLKDGLLQKSALQVMFVVFDNIPKLLQDPEISDEIKLKININKIVDLMIRINLAFSDKPMSAQVSTSNGVEAQLLMDHFTRISSKLKVDACGEYARATHWNVRKEGLWKWCLVMAEETRHPLVRYFETTQNPKFKEAILTNFKALFEVIAELIMFIAFCDDISDNLAEKEVSDLFKQVPFLQEHQIQEEIKKIEKISGGIFKDFYIQSVRVWQDCIKKFKALVGTDLLASRWEQLSELYTLIMDSMSLSVELNLDPHKYTESVPTVDKGLAPNMMIESFRWMERLLLDSLLFSYSSESDLPLPRPSVETKINTLISLSQISGSQANSMATLYREILTEDDLSNPIVYRINKAYAQKLEEKSSTLEKEFQDFLQENSYVNHFFADYESPKDFIDFMILKNHIVRLLLNELKSLCLLHKIKMNFGEHGNLQEMVTQMLPEIQEKVTAEVYQNDKKGLERRLKHLVLSNQFIKKITIECESLLAYASEHVGNFSAMRSLAEELPAEFQSSAEEYIKSWEVFTQMYLLFKHKPSGMI